MNKWDLTKHTCSIWCTARQGELGGCIWCLMVYSFVIIRFESWRWVMEAEHVLKNMSFANQTWTSIHIYTYDLAIKTSIHSGYPSLVSLHQRLITQWLTMNGIETISKGTSSQHAPHTFHPLFVLVCQPLGNWLSVTHIGGNLTNTYVPWSSYPPIWFFVIRQMRGTSYFKQPGWYQTTMI